MHSAAFDADSAVSARSLLFFCDFFGKILFFGYEILLVLELVGFIHCRKIFFHQVICHRQILTCRCCLLLVFLRLGNHIICIELHISVTLHTGSCRDQLTDDNIFLQADQRINFTVDCCFRQYLGGLLEGCS